MSEPFRSRDYRPVPPRERPRKERAAARVVVTDGEAVLMFRDSDPGIPGSQWYVTPGGGIEPGETPLQAAVRELHEETGLSVAPSALVGPLMRRLVVHGYSDQICAQTEVFYLVRTPRFDLDLSGHTEDERLTIKGDAWLPIAELDAQDVPVWPVRLAELISLAEDPPAEPVDWGTVEESTLACDAS
ncbi:NUDIX hydrolase [Nigerium massiliense]|uniref:NUDIX hydrolase n=1 Tax=Nigerium massiliense TaxID=1522317 RepID=UPI00058F2661|nr:NUDIX domain-containing protein [Nigerium massiliense]